MTPQGKGIATALAAALAFGASIPLLERFGVEVAPVTLAGLLYGGAAAVLALVRVLFPTAETPLRRQDSPWLAGMVLAGAVAGPILLLYGLQRASGVAASLLLSLEPALTVVLALAFFREHASGRAAAGIALLIGAAAILGLRGPRGGATASGVLFIAAACSCWALDNNLTQRLSLRDPVAVALWKAALGSACTLVAGRALGEAWPAPRALFIAAVIGAVSYGLSVAWAVRSMRDIGAARYAAIFSVAPFCGALLSVPLLSESLHPLQLVAAAVMAAGLWLLARDRHEHRHAHAPLVHEHLHVHDEHHQHSHEGPVEEPHSHVHQHEALTHAHPHTADAHHRHGH